MTHRANPRLPVVLTLAAVAAALVLAPARAARAGDVLEYEGVYVCRKCHSMTKRDYYDDAYEIWKKSPHAHAYESLKSEQSMKVAREHGVEDPLTDERCVRCHVTAWGADPAQLGKFYAVEESVTCEACHGPGSEYKKKEIHAEDYEKALTLGFHPIATREEVEKTCVTCHNSDSPTFEADYMDRWHEWQHPTVEGREGVEGPAKKDRGGWAPKPAA